MTDPISDMLTRIRNATRAGHPEVVVPFSNFKKKIAEIMKKKGFIERISENSENGKNFLKMNLKYSQNEKGSKGSYIQGLQRISRQGQRIYVGKDHIPVVRNGFGFAVISTSKGLMTDNEARRAGLGGEIICEIW
ncbi:MAG: 30S ribosomal protein S8 [Candidatus Moranbacteria bacterium]|nr:30S ribosomal protein S8 [Candidatus Moranbacteria bacterium]